MGLIKRLLLLLVVSCVVLESLQAQMPYFHPSKNSRAGATDLYRNPLKIFLNKFSVTGTAGYGLALYSHKLNGEFYFIEHENQQYIVPVGGNRHTFLRGIVTGYSNWFNKISPSDTLVYLFEPPFAPIDNPVLNPDLDVQPSAIKFRSYSHSIPLTLSVHFNSGRYRIGAGATFERQHFTEFKQVNTEEQKTFQPEVSPVLFQRYYGMIGYRFYDFWNFSFASEAQLGILKGGRKSFDPDVIDRSNFFNFGISIEQNLSEYFRVIVRPSFDFHSFRASDESGLISIPHKQQTFFIQAGISINIPDIRRCPLPACHVQLKHVHSGEEVRGQPITKHQNPKVGQNHRKLFRYKWLNKRKMEPY